MNIPRYFIKEQSPMMQTFNIRLTFLFHLYPLIESPFSWLYCSMSLSIAPEATTSRAQTKNLLQNLTLATLWENKNPQSYKTLPKRVLCI